jgi:hypothetical protein
VTSDKTYENKEWVWGYRETDRLGGHDPYSNSKACSELVTQSFRDSFFAAAGGSSAKAIATARAGNVIGGGDWTRDQLIPDVMNAFHEKRPVVLRNPQATRPWQFVLDCLDGYVTLAEKISTDGARYAGPWNFGPHPEDTLSVQNVVERLIDKWPGKASWVLDADSHPHEAGSLRLDTSKTMLQLGWKPRLRADESLDWIVDWYGRYFQGADPKALCLEQIGRFEMQNRAGNRPRASRAEPLSEKLRPSLCLGAHCDDIEIGCGGTMLRLARERPDVSVHWVVFGSDTVRAREARDSASRFLGGVRHKTVTVKDFRSSFFPYCGEQIKESFEQLKSEVAPDIIFTHSREDLHQDHRIVSELTWNTFRDHLILEYEIPV